MEFHEEDLVISKEKLYFIILCIVSGFIYLIAVISLFGIIIIISMLCFYWLMHNLAIVNIRKNGVKINEHQFPHFYEHAKNISNRMKLTQIPDIYVIQSGGILNAFATKFGLKNMVVLYSDVFSIIDEQGEDEVCFILAHEFAHIKRSHIGFGWLLMPALIIPFLNNAYSRACEFTCDRFGAYYSQSYEAAQNALVILSIGPQIYNQVDQIEFMKQIETETSVFSWLDEILSTHPNLPKRVHAISDFFLKDKTPSIKTSNRGAIIGIASIMSLTILFFLAIFLTVMVSSLAEENLPLEDESINEETPYTYDRTTMNSLMLAAVDGDYDFVLLNPIDATTLNEVSGEGYTALHLAVMESNYQISSSLLRKGADPNTRDEYGYTPLIDAASNGDLELVTLLLAFGADKTARDANGYNAYHYAENSGHTNVADYILNFKEY
ncbi:M48 family metallopeptidase [Lysinibacillus sp. 54212]|uniref:M48 family metallopeptidase n=1 Tax=Lysinibacillus sp. 54212 TaxID=3119829 RepID=UPI002FCC6681